MKYETLRTHFQALLAAKNTDALEAFAQETHPADIAAVLHEADMHDTKTFLTAISSQRRAILFGYLEEETQKELLETLSFAVVQDLFAHMASDERADLYGVASLGMREKILPLLTKVDQEDIHTLASYDEELVGSIMTSDCAVLQAQMRADEAIAQLREVAGEVETIYVAYVVEPNRKLVGVLTLEELIVAEPSLRVQDFMHKKVIRVRVDAPREEAARSIAKYDFIALPVVDEEDRLVGMVTYDDAMDVAAWESEEDFQKMAGHTVGHGGGFAASVKDATISMLYKKRVFWLVVLVFGNIFSGAGIAYFEETIAAYVALVFFLPLLIDSGGNAGAQSATLMVRAMATGDVAMKDWAGMLGREMLVAGLLGLTMAFAVSVLGVWRGGTEIALVVGLTMQVVVIVGSVIGMSLPFLLSRFKCDPATASAPLITSIADAAGVVIYFGIATWLLELPLS